MWRARSINCSSYLAVWGFFGSRCEGGDFKGYVNGALNVETKGVESFRGSGSERNSPALTEERG